MLPGRWPVPTGDSLKAWWDDGKMLLLVDVLSVVYGLQLFPISLFAIAAPVAAIQVGVSSWLWWRQMPSSRAHWYEIVKNYARVTLNEHQSKIVSFAHPFHMSTTLVCFWRYEAPEHEDVLPDHDGNVYGRGHPGRKTHLIGFFFGWCFGREWGCGIYDGGKFAWMFFDGFLLRRNKHVRRNREFETSKGLTIFLRYSKEHASHHVVNGVRPGGSHKYVMGICEWFLKVFHFRSTLCLQSSFFADIPYQRAFNKIIFSLHFVQAATDDVKHLYRFKVFSFFKNMGKF